MKPPTVLNKLQTLVFRDGECEHETIEFGVPWEPSDWRSRWVEVFEPATTRIGH